MFKRLISAALVFGMAAIAPPANAQSCAPRDLVVERLKRGFGEILTSAGLQTSGPVDLIVEVWASPKTGSFSILLSHPNGLSCLVATGRDYFVVPAPEAAPDPAS